MGEPLWFQAYGRLPVWMQNAACSAAGVRMRRERHGRAFRTALEFLERSQHWSRAELEAHQDERLRILLEHAYETVPYYRELFDRLRLKPRDIRGARDLPKLPLLDKPTIRQRGADLLSAGWPRHRRRYGHTGGTTGTALEVVCDVETIAWQWAVWWRHRRRFGARLEDPFIVFGGKNVVPLARLKAPFWRRNHPMRQTYVSIHHMTRENMPALVDYLQTRRVGYYSGYPSGLYLLAAHLLATGERLATPPPLVFTGSESLLPHQRQALTEAFEAIVADQYGATEQCANMSECEHHVYHVDMEFGIVEFLPIEGLPGNARRIVCTGLYNPVMPLIRYDIGDVALLRDGPCTCGRASPTVEAIDGRIESYIVTPVGRRLGRLDFLFKYSRRIEEAQLVQDDADHVTVRIVRGEGYGTEDERQLMGDLRRYLGDVIRIDLEPVAAIPREPNGKFRQIVSRVMPEPMDVVA
jgi:phenylacetate-CoA ligase